MRKYGEETIDHIFGVVIACGWEGVTPDDVRQNWELFDDVLKPARPSISTIKRLMLRLIEQGKIKALGGFRFKVGQP